MKDPRDSRKAPRPANFARFLGEFHSVAKQASLCNAFGRDFGGLWKPKWMQKLMLGLVFFDVVLECAFALILVRIFEAPNLKNQALASTGARFLQNRRFRKRYEKNIILALFFEAEAKKIRFKIASKMCCFKAPHFERFFFNFGCILESKNLCKITKFRNKLRFGGSF